MLVKIIFHCTFMLLSLYCLIKITVLRVSLSSQYICSGLCEVTDVEILEIFLARDSTLPCDRQWDVGLQMNGRGDVIKPFRHHSLWAGESIWKSIKTRCRQLYLSLDRHVVASEGTIYSQWQISRAELALCFPLCSKVTPRTPVGPPRGSWPGCRLPWWPPGRSLRAHDRDGWERGSGGGEERHGEG